MPDTLDAVAKAICPHLRSGNPCQDCPAKVETDYGPGTQACRLFAMDAARSALLALAEMDLSEDALNRGADVLLMAETERGETYQDDCREIFRIVCRALAHPTDDGASVGG